MSNAQSANATVGNFTKNLGGLEQSLLFNLYPNNAWTSYLNSTSVVYSPENLEVAVGNQTNHVRFNIGGYHSSYSEVMRLVNPNGSHNTSDPPDPRVGIGTVNPLFTLHVETDTELTGPLMVRGMIAGKKTGIFNIIPYKDRVYLGFGMYGLNGHFYNDPYYDFLTGTNSKNGAKLCIRPNQGVYWFAYGPSDITVSNNRINDWTVFPGSMTDGKLWDIHGTWICPACPSSSRTLKENFAAINLEDILGKIDQLEVPRWNYKSDNRSVTHIGPMAEDFYSLFKTGSRESQLHLIDSAGVSLAGVKDLLAKANRQEQRLEELGREIEDLKVQLSKKRARK
ncbi:MAG: tail fiber domain-containing protein [Candidatus Omnitrophica bacterium]|nr:tail fiber domain-containing protein [Candidatus Omnitrophota bacterium]